MIDFSTYFKQQPQTWSQSCECLFTSAKQNVARLAIMSINIESFLQKKFYCLECFVNVVCKL